MVAENTEDGEGELLAEDGRWLLQRVEALYAMQWAVQVGRLKQRVALMNDQAIGRQWLQVACHLHPHARRQGRLIGQATQPPRFDDAQAQVALCGLQRGDEACAQGAGLKVGHHDHGVSCSGGPGSSGSRRLPR